jgi:ribosomal protein S18 acetylase RimI-like enzyme
VWNRNDDLVKVREFAEADYEAVKDLWEKGKPGIGYLDTLEQVKVKVKRDPDLFLVAEDEGRLVGSVLGAWDGRRGWVYHLAVLPEKRRSGIASILLKEVEDRMNKKGAWRVNALVFKSNQASLGFFKKMGYSSNEELVLQSKNLRQV